MKEVIHRIACVLLAPVGFLAVCYVIASAFMLGFIAIDATLRLTVDHPFVVIATAAVLSVVAALTRP